MPLGGNFLTIHVGQAGCQIGHALWELLCVEHNLTPDGCLWSQECEDASESYDAMFVRSASSQRFLPRSLFIDTDTSCIDEIRSGQYRCLFGDHQLVTAGEDAAANYSVGRFGFQNLVEESGERVRWMMEKAELTPTFFVIHSTSGGTGSGVTTSCLEKLKETVGEAKKLEVMELSVMPGKAALASQAEMLNSALYQSESSGLTSVSFSASNSSLFNVCSSSLGLSSATFAHANRLLAAAVSNLTATERYPGSVPCTMSSICTNVLPLKELKYPILACCPFVSCQSAEKAALSVTNITNGVLSPSNQFVDVDLQQGKYMACALVYRGAVQSYQVTKAVQQLKAENRLPFVDWCPTGFKVGLVDAPPISAPLSGMGNPSMSVTLVSNTTAVGPLFRSRAESVRGAMQRKSFMHHYAVGEQDGDAVGSLKQKLEAAASHLEAVADRYTRDPSTNAGDLQSSHNTQWFSDLPSSSSASPSSCSSSSTLKPSPTSTRWRSLGDGGWVPPAPATSTEDGLSDEEAKEELQELQELQESISSSLAPSSGGCASSCRGGCGRSRLRRTKRQLTSSNSAAATASSRQTDNAIREADSVLRRWRQVVAEVEI